MKEIRTIKMVEVTDIKFVADDGKEFVGENAERDCRDYERTRDQLKVKKAFEERVDMTAIEMPFVNWFCDEATFYKVQLNSKADFVAMMDYFNVVWEAYNYIKTPPAFPYTMYVTYSYETVNEYSSDIQEELEKALAQLS